MLLWKKPQFLYSAPYPQSPRLAQNSWSLLKLKLTCPLQRRRDGVKLFWVLTTETEKEKQFVRYSPPSVYHYALVTSIYHQARELPTCATTLWESSWLILGRPHSSHQHIYLIRRCKIYIKKLIHNVDSLTAITSWADTLLSPTSLSSARSCMGSSNNYAFMSSWQKHNCQLAILYKSCSKSFSNRWRYGIYSLNSTPQLKLFFFSFPSYIALSMFCTHL